MGKKVSATGKKVADAWLAGQSKGRWIAPTTHPFFWNGRPYYSGKKEGHPGASSLIPKHCEVLSPILNALNILRQMKTNDPIIENAGQIIGCQVGQMVRLVDDLLDITRITKGKLRLTKEKVELRVIVNHAAETIRPLMEARKHEFSVALPTIPIWFEAGPARLEQVVVNLLNNAAKYTDPA